MLINFALFITTIFTLAGFLGQYGFWLDMTAHFRVQYLIIQLVCLLVYLLKREWKYLAVAVCAALINLILIIPVYIPDHDKNAHGKIVSILLVNLNAYNDQYDKVVELIKQKKPDILALEELNDIWFSKLVSLLQSYPYQKFYLRQDCFGIGLFSHIPTESLDIRTFGPANLPSVVAKYSIDDKPVSLLLTHPLPPGSFQYFHLRNAQLKDIASQRASFEQRLIVIGDLNATSWSYYFKEFIKKMHLVDTRPGFGLQITWPTSNPLLGVTIDHILVSNNFEVLERSVGPDIGSDHYPIYIKLQMD